MADRLNKSMENQVLLGRYNRMRQEADAARLIRQSRADRPRRDPVFARLQSWMGHRMLAWGVGLERSAQARIETAHLKLAKAAGK